jgi:HlyD family secretion protein
VAVVHKHGADVLYAVNNNRVVEKPVRLGEAIGDMVEVLEGAKAGERVVLNPPPALHNGLPVKIAEK